MLSSCFTKVLASPDPQDANLVLTPPTAARLQDRRGTPDSLREDNSSSNRRIWRHSIRANDDCSGAHDESLGLHEGVYCPVRRTQQRTPYRLIPRPRISAGPNKNTADFCTARGSQC